MARKNDYTMKIDNYVGQKVHERRITMGLSRQELSCKIGVTHQQLQKYENGKNRICAGRLAAIAKALGKPIEYFFEGAEENADLLPTQHQRMCIEVSRNFLGIRNLKHQNIVNLLVRTLADN